MARERDFELKIAGGTALAGMLTLSALDAPLEEVLPQVLEGLPYTVSYRIDALTGTRLPSRVFVGQGAELASAPASVASPPKPNRARAAAPSDPREDDREKRESAQRAYLDELESDDFNVRANAAALAYADPEAVPAISDLLESDPDPQVRAAAAGTLGEADDSPAAVRALLRALNDPDPAVVIEAIDGLEWTADASVIPDMQFLLDHPSGEVRERTVEAIEWFAD
jgi:HEAT repeat protein